MSAGRVSSPGASWEEGKFGKRNGKKGSLERGSKMVGTTNHLACEGVEGRLEGGMVNAPTVLPLSNHPSPSPAGCFTMSTCPHVGHPLPHHNQICPLKLTGPHKFSCCPFTNDTLHVLVGS